MSTLVLRSLIENNTALVGNTPQTEPDVTVALSILVIASAIAFAAAAKAVGSIAMAAKTLVWLVLAVFFLLLAIGVVVSLAVAYLG